MFAIKPSTNNTQVMAGPAVSPIIFFLSRCGGEDLNQCAVPTPRYLRLCFRCARFGCPALVGRSVGCALACSSLNIPVYTGRDTTAPKKNMMLFSKC